MPAPPLPAALDSTRWRGWASGAGGTLPQPGIVIPACAEKGVSQPAHREGPPPASPMNGRGRGAFPGHRSGPR
jgi:hypothetical protein